MNKTTVLTLALMCTALIATAQKNVYLNITHKLGTSGFGFNQTAQNNLAQDFRITRVDYYLSGITIIHDGGQELAVPGHYILVKGNSNLSDLLGSFNVSNVEKIKFSVGVESPTNNSDPALYTAPHPLAPQNPSMHWGWSSGFRFVALEGKSGSNFGTVFQMHGLGNANYFTQTQTAAVVSNNSDIYIHLEADYTQALKGVDVNAGPIDHGVNATDLKVLQNFRDFVFKPGLATSLVSQQANAAALELYPNPAGDWLYIKATGAVLPATVEIRDVSGRLLAAMDYTENQAIDLRALTQGLYSLSLLDSRQQLIACKTLAVQ